MAFYLNIKQMVSRRSLPSLCKTRDINRSAIDVFHLVFVPVCQWLIY